MSADDVFKAAWRLLKQDLKEHRFFGSGSATHRSCRGLIELISPQKSNRSTREAVLATINFGVFSPRVAAGMAESAERSPAIERAHWRRRAQFPEGEWLTIRSIDDPGRVAAALGDVVLGTVLPELEKRSSDELLRDEWLTGSAPGLTALQRLLFLVVLLRDLGPRECLPESIKALRALGASSSHVGLVEFELKRLGLSEAGQFLGVPGALWTAFRGPDPGHR